MAIFLNTRTKYSVYSETKFAHMQYFEEQITCFQ